MPEEKEETPTQEASAKPTITIAEKDGSGSTAEAKPTITIAEKDGGE